MSRTQKDHTAAEAPEYAASINHQRHQDGIRLVYEDSAEQGDKKALAHTKTTRSQRHGHNDGDDREKNKVVNDCHIKLKRPPETAAGESEKCRAQHRKEDGKPQQSGMALVQEKGFIASADQRPDLGIVLKPLKQREMLEKILSEQDNHARN